MTLSLSLFLLFQTIKTSISIQLDVHLPLSTNSSSCIYQIALEANKNLNQWSSSQHTNEQIHFRENSGKDLLTNITQIPHTTLFLTDYSVENISSKASERQGSNGVNNTKLNDLIKATSDAICHTFADFSSRHYYNAMIKESVVSGSYAMYRIQVDDQLQKLSNDIVQFTQPFVKRNQSIPQWVNDMGDDQIRKKKIDYVKRYGSPNVFDEFDPHVTVGYDDYNGIKSDDKNLQRGRILNHLPWKNCGGWIDEVRIGLVGKYGTVIGVPLASLKFDECGDKIFHASTRASSTTWW